ncbi:MAG: DUF342 domain-containing protein [Phycisphaerales bacterium JB054]
MYVTSAHPLPNVVLAEDRSSATIVLPAGLDAEAASELSLRAVAREKGLELTRAVCERISAVSARYLSDHKPISEEIARAMRAVEGADARIEWMEGFDPKSVNDGPVPGEDGSVDYYDRKSFICVAAGERVATIHAATEGTDGRDVCGGTIPATPGKRLGVVIDGSLELDDRGGLIAQIDGVLKFSAGTLRIDPVLEIAGTVDFSTGHIDFEGDVLIQNDIRDRFRVRSRDNVVIDGLIDASHIECGGTLRARRGVAGRDEGTLDVGGDAEIGYIDKVRGRIGGSLQVGGEIMHSDLTVGGNLHAPSGRVIGGRLHVMGNVAVGELGSRVETPTLLLVGPKPDPAENSGTTLDLAALRPMVNTAPAPEPACTSEIEVHRVIHARVTLQLGGQTVTIGREVRGPIRIWLEGQTLMHQLGTAEPSPLLQLPGVQRSLAA